MKKYLSTAAAAALASGLAFAGTAGAAGNLLTNPSFESSSAYVTPAGFTTGKGAIVLGSSGAASTAITGWTVTKGQVAYVENYSTTPTAAAVANSWQPQDGSYSISLFTNNDITTSFATVIGQNYTVDYWYSGDPMFNATVGVGGATEVRANTSLAKYVNGVVFVPGNSQNINFDTSANTRAAMGWQEATFRFTAADVTSTITFTGVGVPSSTPLDGVVSGNVAIDNVSVIAAPEPASWALMMVGIGGVGAVMRRRKTVVAA